ncbi:hypothetical protein B8X04_03045 [Brevibacterium casei]|uniref:Polysaccharide biosynthesis protein n=1 Tax=Brevibacterium casei TaxID=33889 RepID=A0A269ZGM8_9MICO|nr:oligosaccharide flippase family protein [Brevibacterium casei]PAK96895.1 hypothetical protein B8X04_03045 [Brevibacterium casei]
MVLVTVGNIMVATAQWYLIWLFARHAGPQAVGVYSSLVAFMTPLFIIAQLGLRNLYITLQTSVRWPVYLAVRGAGIVLAGSLSAVVLVAVVPEDAWVIGAAVLVIKVANSIADLYFARLQRAERLRTFGVLLIIDAATTASVTTVIIALGGSVDVAVLAAAVVALVGAAATILLGRRMTTATGGTAEAQTGGEIRCLLRHGSPLALSQGIQSILTYLPIAIVGWLGTTADIGVYSSAAYLVTFANLLGASVQITLLSDFRRRFEASGPSLLRQAIRRNSVVSMAVLAPLVGLAVVIGPQLLALVYGPTFDISRLSVLFLSLAAVIVLPTYLLSSLHLVLNRYWVMTIVGAGSIVVVGAAGAAGGALGLGPVESGSLAVLVGAAARYVGADVLSRPEPFTPEAPLRQKAELS